MRHPLRAAVVVTLGAVLAASVLPSPLAAASGPLPHRRLQAALDRAVAHGAPGIVAQVQDGDRRWFGSAGLSDTATRRRRAPDERFRIGSTTKAFTATVVLQLVAEHALGLDDTVEKWLPGVVRGNGNDGRRITIRQLLDHTSGLFAYTNDPAFFAQGVGAAWSRHRFDHHSPEELVRIAMSHPPYFAPGKGFVYSNTDSILAAMIVERATGCSFATQLQRRIIRPLGLTGTSLPGDLADIPGPHPVHYSTLFSTDPHPSVVDATRMNQSFAGAAGGMISTTGDLTRFFAALLGGRLLPPPEQSQLLTTVSTDGAGWIPNTRYGLGVFSQTLPCGVTVWGHGGATYGSWSYVMGTRDGRHLLAAQVNGDWSGLGVFDDLLAAEFCPPARS